MKVKNLIKSLQKYDPETLVVVDGYEDGFETPDRVRTLLVHGPYLDNKDYYGDYEEESSYNPRTDKKPTVKAVYLSRYKKG